MAEKTKKEKIYMDIPFSSNSVQLSPGQWLVVLVIVIALFYIIPAVWAQLDGFDVSGDDSTRVAYEMGNDYWMYSRWCDSACRQDKVINVGDSFVWGAYVKKDETLACQLNKTAGKAKFINMGQDGAHPAALSGIIKYYGKSIKNKKVLLHLNLLWMSSEKHDLRCEEEFRFNHPKLVYQFIPNIKCYRPSLADRVGVIMDRYIPYFVWLNHMKAIYFDNLSTNDWIIQNPYKKPIDKFTLEIPEDKVTKPMTWQQRGIPVQDFTWMKAEDSFQWLCFRETVNVLRARGNDVFVLIGPFNPHIMVEQSKARFGSMKKQMQEWFAQENVPFCSACVLPSDYYADASHPISAGYALIAEELYKNKIFQEWIGN